MPTSSDVRFGRWRSYLWPVQKSELIKFIPLLLIFFFICLDYSILKSFKDSLMITAPQSGAKVIPFVKLYIILPAALLVTYLFTKLFNRYSQEKVFYIMVGSFLLLFFLFAFVLYPFRDVIHPTATADRLQAVLPLGFSGLICLFRNWSYTLFYALAELWGTAVMSVLFWGFVNQITSIKEAKRYYGILIAGANLSLVLSGYIIRFLSNQTLDLLPFFDQDPWGKSLGLSTCLIITSGLITMGVFRWYHKRVLKSQNKQQKMGEKRKKSVKMGMRKNFLYLSKSKYLICTAIIVVAFNLALSTIEIVWKDQIHQLHPNPNGYNAYMGEVQIAIGWICCFLGFFCTFLIRRLNWTFNALITPIILLTTGVLFFGFTLLKHHPLAISFASLLGLTPTALAVFLGSTQNVLSRICKYTIFDATKEIALIPLSPESKLKGKAAIDGIGSRLGKSGSSLFHSLFIALFGSISVITPYLAILLLGIVLAWIGTAKSLGRQFNLLVSKNEKLTIQEKEQTGASEKKPLVESF